MLEPIINLTEAAAIHIKKMLEKEKGGLGFRLAIKKTGCSGYAYLPQIINQVDINDLHFVAHDLNIYIDHTCQELVKGLVIDYVVDNQMGLKQKRLVFINPNEKTRCGCGESFTIE